MALRRRILPFHRCQAPDGSAQVGRIHGDGSVTFRARTYRSIKELPPDCHGLRLDVDTYRQWRRLYEAIAPASRRGRRWPRWSRQ